MDVTIRVRWSDGSVSHHAVCGLPYSDVAVIQEVLEHKLADYLDLDSEGPTDDEGVPLGWVAVELVDS
jgi:hypothetical protein